MLHDRHVHFPCVKAHHKVIRPHEGQLFKTWFTQPWGDIGVYFFRKVGENGFVRSHVKPKFIEPLLPLFTDGTRTCTPMSRQKFSIGHQFLCDSKHGRTLLWVSYQPVRCRFGKAYDFLSCKPICLLSAKNRLAYPSQTHFRFFKTASTSQSNIWPVWNPSRRRQRYPWSKQNPSSLFNIWISWLQRCSLLIAPNSSRNSSGNVWRDHQSLQIVPRMKVQQHTTSKQAVFSSGLVQEPTRYSLLKSDLSAHMRGVWRIERLIRMHQLERRLKLFNNLFWGLNRKACCVFFGCIKKQKSCYQPTCPGTVVCDAEINSKHRPWSMNLW